MAPMDGDRREKLREFLRDMDGEDGINKSPSGRGEARAEDGFMRDDKGGHVVGVEQSGGPWKMTLRAPIVESCGTDKKKIDAYAKTLNRAFGAFFHDFAVAVMAGPEVFDKYTQDILESGSKAKFRAGHNCNDHDPSETEGKEF